MPAASVLFVPQARPGAVDQDPRSHFVSDGEIAPQWQDFRFLMATAAVIDQPTPHTSPLRKSQILNLLTLKKM